MAELPQKTTCDTLRHAIRHIIALSFDACAASHLSCHGYFRKTTPHIDALAEEGVRFSQFFCEYPNTAVNFRPIMLSKYPEMNEHWTSFPQLRKGASRNLPEYFKEAGFATGCFSGNSFFGPNHGFADGWDAFGTARELGGHLRADAVCGMSMEWLAQRNPEKERILLWTHLLEPHNPYHAPAPWDHLFAQDYPVCPGSDSRAEVVTIATAEAKRQAPNDATRHMEAAYDGSLAYGDHELAPLLAQLREMGILEHALVMVTADHGEGWGEHGRYCHNNCIYDEEMKVPMIVRLPAALERQGLVSDAIAESVDILPTLLDATGLLPPSLNADGVSMLPLIAGESDSVKPYVYGRAGQEGNHTQASHEHVYSIRTRTHKLVWDTLTDRRELYDIATDPKETRDLYRPEDEVAMALRRQLESWMTERKRMDL